MQRPHRQELIVPLLVFCSCRALYGNNLNGTIPDSIGSLTALRGLCVHEPRYTVPLLRADRGAPFTVGSYLGDQLRGTIPCSLGNLTALNRLCVHAPT